MTACLCSGRYAFNLYTAAERTQRHKLKYPSDRQDQLSTSYTQISLCNLYPSYPEQLTVLERSGSLSTAAEHSHPFPFSESCWEIRQRVIPHKKPSTCSEVVMTNSHIQEFLAKYLYRYLEFFTFVEYKASIMAFAQS